jgi:hypothetical protein
MNFNQYWLILYHTGLHRVIIGQLVNLNSRCQIDSHEYTRLMCYEFKIDENIIEIDYN